MALRATAATALALAAAAAPPPGSLFKVIPFTKIADEIYEAERAAEELEWKVSNSSAEKASVQWFISTAMRELTEMKKVIFNTSHIDNATGKPSLGREYESCVNRTSAKMPNWNASRTVAENIKADKDLAPSTVEAHMYELYTLEQKAETLKAKLGDCASKCPAASLLAKRRSKRRLRSKTREDPAAPAPAPGGGGGGGNNTKPNPRELMRSVADAIYNTSKGMESMQDKLKKDKSAKDVLNSITAVVTTKLLKAKKDLAQMREDLELCRHTAGKTEIGGHLQEAMQDNTDLTQDVLAVAAAQTQGAKATVTDLEEKLATCKRKCEI